MDNNKELYSIRLEGMGMAMTPIYHSSGTKRGKKEKTVDECIKWTLANGATQPVGNGGALRGILRDLASTIIASRIGGFNTIDDFRLYYGGGSSRTVEKDALNITDLKQQREFRSKNIFVSLFGGQIKRIEQGHLRVGFLIPYTEASRNLIPDYFVLDGIQPLPITTDKALFTRKDDSFSAKYEMHLTDNAIAERDAELQKVLERNAPAETEESDETGESDTNSTENGQEADKNIQMIRRPETIPAGSRLYNAIDVVNATMEEIGLVVATLQAFADNPYFGGKSSSGYGRINLSYNLIRNNDKEDQALVISDNEGFKLNNNFLSECLAAFNAWLDGLTPEDAHVFGKLSDTKKAKGKEKKAKGAA